jgi:gamma-glutamylaminecyclotransferase
MSASGRNYFRQMEEEIEQDYYSFQQQMQESKTYAERMDELKEKTQKEFEECDLVFTYGTLMRGYGNNTLLEGAFFKGEAETVEKYMLTASGVPFVHPKHKNVNIKGEVWEVRTLRQLLHLDALESHPNWYKREIIEVKVKNKIKKAWIYFNEDSVGTEIPSGDYRDYRPTYTNFD